MRLLIEKDPLGLNRTNSAGQSLLHLASKQNASYSIQYLLEQKLDLNQVDSQGNRPIDYLLDAYSPDWEVVRLMLPNTDQATPRFAGFLLKAIFEDEKSEFLYPLLDRCPELLKKVNYIKLTIDFLVTNRKSNKINAIKELISAGLNPNFTENHYTLLHSIIDANQVEMVDWLCANGVDINACSGYTYPPLIHATFENRWDIVDLLIDRGASLNVKDSRGKTILELAAQNNRWPTVKKLIVIGADLSPLKDLQLPEDINQLIESRKQSRTDFFQSKSDGAADRDDQKMVPKLPQGFNKP